MAAIQSSQTNQTYPFVLGGIPFVRDQSTIKQDSSRTAALAQFTVMAQIASTSKWVPWSSLTASDGSSLPLGILMDDGGFTAAAIAAGDVTGATILVGGAGLRIDSTQIVFDTGVGGSNVALALTSILTSNAAGSGTATPYWTMIAERFLNQIGIFPQATVVEDLAEN